MSAEPAPKQATPDGVRFYAVTALLALLAASFPLLLRGLEFWALLPSLLGALSLAARWRIGPIPYLLSLFWLALADRVGVSPLELVPYLMAAVLRIESHGGVEGNFASPLRMRNAVPILDMFLAVAAVLYVAAHYRFLSVTRNLFPLDRRRRVRRPDAERPVRVVLGPVLEQKRSPALVESQEMGPLMLLASVCVCLAQLLWTWISTRSASLEIAQIRKSFPFIASELWHLALLLWCFSLFLIVVFGLIAYLGQRRLTADEAELYLQDELWRQTRREQSRLNRWLAWAVQRRKRRAAARAAKRALREKMEKREKS